MSAKVCDCCLFALMLFGTPVAAGVETFVPTGGPGGGRVSLIESQRQNVYATLLEPAAMFRSQDGGATWSPVGAGLPETQSIRTLGVTPSAVFAGTTNEVFVSVDAGETFAPVDYGVADALTLTLISRGSDMLLLVDVLGPEPHVLLSSADNGESWQPIDLPEASVNQVFVDGDNLLATGGFAVLYRSVDAGETWEEVGEGLPNDLLVLVARNENAILINGAFGGGAYRSLDDGLTWSQLPDSPSMSFQNNSGIISLADGTFIMARRATSSGELEIYISADDGASWTPGEVIDLFEFGGAANVIPLAPSGTDIVLGVSTGVLRSTDLGHTFTESNDGLVGTTIVSLGSAMGRLYASPYSAASNLFSDDNGATWDVLDGGIEPTFVSLESFLAFDGFVFTGSRGQGVFRSADGGDTWSTVNSGLPTYVPNDGGTYEPINAFAVIGDTIFVGTGGANEFIGNDPHCGCTGTTSGDGVYRTTNNGQSWQRVSNGLPINMIDPFGAPILRPIEALVAVGSTLFAGTPSHGVYRSTNLGGSWTNVPGVPGAVELATIGDAVYAVAGTNDIYHLADPAGSFTQLETNLPDVQLHNIVALDGALYVSGAHLFNQTDGVYRSMDGGETWEQIGGPLSDRIVAELAVHDGQLFAGVVAGGVWRLDETTAGDLNDDAVVDEEDRALLCAALGTSTGDPEFIDAADFDENGTIDELDQQAFNNILPPCGGDIVTSKDFQPPPDGIIDGADLAFLLGAWGAQPSCADMVTSDTFQPPPDGTVDGADLAFLLGAWGMCK